MSVDEAASYHSLQAYAFAAAGAQMMTALTMTYAEEAIGVVEAAGQVDLPVVVSFTVETDGRLPSGQSLGDAIEQVDRATDGAAAYFMINCAHPTHIARGLDDSAALSRVGGLRVNASALSHAELDEGDPRALARDNASLRSRLPSIRLLGGCCGTDARHVTEIAAAWN